MGKEDQNKLKEDEKKQQDDNKDNNENKDGNKEDNNENKDENKEDKKDDDDDTGKEKKHKCAKHSDCAQGVFGALCVANKEGTKVCVKHECNVDVNCFFKNKDEDKWAYCR